MIDSGTAVTKVYVCFTPACIMVWLRKTSIPRSSRVSPEAFGVAPSATDDWAEVKALLRRRSVSILLRDRGKRSLPKVSLSGSSNSFGFSLASRYRISTLMFFAINVEKPTFFKSKRISRTVSPSCQPTVLQLMLNCVGGNRPRSSTNLVYAHKAANTPPRIVRVPAIILSHCCIVFKSRLSPDVSVSPSKANSSSTAL